MGTVALIYIQTGRVPVRKQTTACLRYALSKGWKFAIVRAGALDEALRLIREGHANVLLLAYPDQHGADEIEQRVEAAGGQVEYCSPGHDRGDRRRPLRVDEADQAALRMHDLGADTDEIVQLFRIPVHRFRDLLRRRRPR